MDWTTYAREVIKRAIAEGRTEGNPEATVAAFALVRIGLERGHPSYFNTQFAIAPFFSTELFGGLAMGVYAWRMVVNGLGGYWQWETHNGGEFSVTVALRHLNIISPEEAENVQQFTEHETHPGCHYVTVKKELLVRIVERFELPTTNKSIGGKSTFALEEIELREYYRNNCIADAGEPSYEMARRSM